MKQKHLLVTSFIFLLLLVLAGCGAKQSVDDGKLTGNITAVGSSAMQPLVELASGDFMALHRNVRIVVQGGGSGTGLTQVSQGAADIGNSDIFAEEKEGIDLSALNDHRICVVGMAVVANPGVGVDNLTKQQLVDIFTGKITNWRAVGGPDQRVVLVNRSRASGTRMTFKQYVLDGAEESAGIEEDSSGTVRKIVRETPGTISYLALPYVDDTVRTISIDGVAPTKENIITNDYPVWAYMHSYTRGEPGEAVKAFIEFMLSEQVQATIIPELGYIPEAEMKVVRDAHGRVTSR